VEDQVVADLDDTEDKEGSGDMPVAMMPTLNQVTLLQVDGVYSREKFQKAFELALEKGREVYAMQRQALTNKFFGESMASKSGEEE
jgi:exosome complex component RRP41